MRRSNRRFSHEEEAASAPNPMDGVANMAEILVNDFGLNKDDFVERGSSQKI